MSTFYYNLSSWMLETIDDRKCTKCKQQITKECVTGIGIREFKSRLVIYLEHMCKKCDHKEITPLLNKKYTLEDMCYSLLEELQKQKTLSVSKSLEPPLQSKPISKKEVDDFIKNLKKISDHDEFMKYIGNPLTEGDQNE